MVRVFLVDDHEVVRRGLVELLGSDPELEVVGEAGSVGEAMVKIPVLRPRWMGIWYPRVGGRTYSTVKETECQPVAPSGIGSAHCSV